MGLPCCGVFINPTGLKEKHAGGEQFVCKELRHCGTGVEARQMKASDLACITSLCGVTKASGLPEIIIAVIINRLHFLE